MTPIVDGWNHNTHYHDRLLASVPRNCSRALDVGCGLGTYARRLAAVAEHVDAVDGDAAVIQQARALSTHLPNLRFIDADFMTWPAGQTYDYISMIAVLHHLPIAAALTKAADLLRPGGVLAVLGLDRAPSVFHEVARSLVAFPVSRYYRMTRQFAPVGAAIQEPAMTLAEIRREANAVLPGSIVRRHLLWRYSLEWNRP